MTMPASGCVGIITCPNSVACTSISQAVSGNVTPPKSLRTLNNTTCNVSSGMTGYYGYAPVSVSNFCLGCLCSTICMCCCGCLTYSVPRRTNECYYPAFLWSLSKSATSTGVASCVQILCNNTSIYCCTIFGTTAQNCSGSFALRCVDYNDCINIITLACRGVSNINCTAYASVDLCAITKCSGDYSIGSPTCQESYQGVVP